MAQVQPKETVLSQRMCALFQKGSCETCIMTVVVIAQMTSLRIRCAEGSGGANNGSTSASLSPAPEFPLDTGATLKVKPPKRRGSSRSGSLRGWDVLSWAPETEAGELDLDLERGQGINRISGLGNQDEDPGLEANTPVSERGGLSPAADEIAPQGVQGSGGRIKRSKSGSESILDLIAPENGEKAGDDLDENGEDGDESDKPGGGGFLVSETLRFAADGPSPGVFDGVSPVSNDSGEGSFVSGPETEDNDRERKIQEGVIPRTSPKGKAASARKLLWVLVTVGSIVLLTLVCFCCCFWMFKSGPPVADDTCSLSSPHSTQAPGNRQESVQSPTSSARNWNAQLLRAELLQRAARYGFASSSLSTN